MFCRFWFMLSIQEVLSNLLKEAYLIVFEMVYSVEERVALWYHNIDYFRATPRTFNVNHPERNVNQYYVK